MVSSSRSRGLRPGGVVRALVRLTMLVSFGFAAGLLFGVLSEEPELLAGHLRGDSQSIILAPTEPGVLGTANGTERAAIEERRRRIGDDDAATEGLPVVAAAPVVVPRAALSQAAAASDDSRIPLSDRTTSKDRPSRGSAVQGTWAIQVGAFAEEAAAIRLTKGLGAKGYPTEMLAASGDSERWRVRIQPVRGEAEAREIAARLKRDERLPTWVILMGDRSSQ